MAKKGSEERDKLVARARRIRGQIEAVERNLTNGVEDCADTLQLLAAAPRRRWWTSYWGLCGRI